MRTIRRYVTHEETQEVAATKSEEEPTKTVAPTWE
jgi:hypothetical protein